MRSRVAVCCSLFVLILARYQLLVSAQTFKPRLQQYEGYSYEDEYKSPKHPAEKHCPPGTARAAAGYSCEPCPIGSYSAGGHKASECYACPAGRTTQNAGAYSIEQCVCEKGFGRPSLDSTVCIRCERGTYSFGDCFDACTACPFPKTTAFIGATSDRDCVCPGGSGGGPDCDQCPPDMVLMANGVCGCAAGHGGSQCEQCQPGFYSTGGKPNNPRPQCKPCGLHFTSPAGAISAAFCQCEAGYGAGDPSLPMWQHICELCPIGTFNPGPVALIGGEREHHIAALPTGYNNRGARRRPIAQSCRFCNVSNPTGGFTTVDVGSKSADQCICAPGHGGPRCECCMRGTYSAGGKDCVCHSCPGNGAGFTTFPENAATSLASCVCVPGYGMTRDGTCRLCPENTFSEGISKADCVPCPFGTTSPPGSVTFHACVRVAQSCPMGQLAPRNAVSASQCGCYPGYGGGSTPDSPCTMCPVGTYAEGGNLEACKPCRFGFTSPMGSTNPADCYPLNQCPAGTDVPEPWSGSSEKDCRCKPGYGSPTGEGTCRLCPVGTYSHGGTMEECRPCPFGTTSRAGAQSLKDCAPVAQACPSGQLAPPNAVSVAQCACLPGHGGGEHPSNPCKPCPAGTWSPGGDTQPCIPCGFGYTSPEAATNKHECYPINACPAGTQYPPGLIRPSSTDECVCKPGFGSSSGKGVCTLCPVGTFSSGGTMEDCKPCPFGYTSPAGSMNIHDCQWVPQSCPIGQTAPIGAVAKQQCTCYPGFGAGPNPDSPCAICPVGTFSEGGSLDICKPCRFGFTSPLGAMSEKECYPVDQCPAGTEVPDSETGASAQECKCKAGYGSPTGEGTCRLCPVGTYSHGGTMEECKPCPFGTTSKPGARGIEACIPIRHACPPGQIAPPDAVSADQCVCLPGHGGGATAKDSCKPCAAGSWAPGLDTQPCIPCGFGYTSPEAATNRYECYPVNACPAGTHYPPHVMVPSSIDECVCKPGFGSQMGKGVCHLCPAGTFSTGGTMEDCKPCPFGYTSAAGASSIKECLRSAQVCPIGQWAPLEAVSKQQCRCYPGFGGGNAADDACKVCPAGTYSGGFSLDQCIPCGFGFTSLAGSSTENDCYPVNQCPAGTEVPNSETGASKQECFCKAGYGSATGEAPCHVCPIGTFSKGGTMEDCKPCPFNTTSAAGSKSVEDCKAVAQPCPVGQIAPPGAVSADQCVCLPGHGGFGGPKDPCRVCPAGSWAPGLDLQPCIPCGFGYTSPEAATSQDECYPVNACPAGTQWPALAQQLSSVDECVCKAGFGSSSGKGVCSLCPAGTFSEGGDMEDCMPCPFGFTSAPGSTCLDDCTPMAQACPLGQWAPFGAVSKDQCQCYKGFGGTNSTDDPCTICPVGTYSANVGTEKCIPCGFGYTSPEGSASSHDCYPVDQCPAGTQPTGHSLNNGGPNSPQECACKPGYGSPTGCGTCDLCKPGYFSKGGSMEDCKPCPFGTTSGPGARSWKDCVPAAQSCPPGQVAPPFAVSKQQCGCLPGYGGGDTVQDACKACPPGTWAPGGDTQPCIPCGFGYTSPEAATSQHECYPMNACPPGTIEPKYGASSAKDCVCMPGFGTEAQEGACHMCPSGYYSRGHRREPCMPCPFGMTSPPGAEPGECVWMAQPCPPGQIIDLQDQPVSADDCHCLPGFGGGATKQDACTICPVGWYAPGVGTQPCLPCAFGYTSPEGSITPQACYEVEICPGGTFPALENPSSVKECVCTPGYGSPSGKPGHPCFWCPPDTFNEGANWDGCKACDAGWWAPPGSPECYPMGKNISQVNSTAVAAAAAAAAAARAARLFRPGLKAVQTPVFTAGLQPVGPTAAAAQPWAAGKLSYSLSNTRLQAPNVTANPSAVAVAASSPSDSKQQQPSFNNSTLSGTTDSSNSSSTSKPVNTPGIGAGVPLGKDLAANSSQATGASTPSNVGIAGLQPSSAASKPPGNGPIAPSSSAVAAAAALVKDTQAKSSAPHATTAAGPAPSNTSNTTLSSNNSSTPGTAALPTGVAGTAPGSPVRKIAVAPGSQATATGSSSSSSHGAPDAGLAAPAAQQIIGMGAEAAAGLFPEAGANWARPSAAGASGNNSISISGTSSGTQL